MTADVSGSPFPFDARLPHLSVAADAAAMEPVFARLFAGAPVPMAVDRCRISRIRYRKHARCLIQYTVSLRDLATGASTEQWIVGAMYAGADAGISLDVFPDDRKLRHAARLVQERDAQLESTLLAAFGPGDWTTTGWSATPVRYRERLALVVRIVIDAVDAASGAPGRKTFYVKTYPDAAEPRRAYEQVTALARHARLAAIGLRVDAPLACLDHLNAIVVESTSGTPLDHVLARDNDETVDAAVRSTAAALAAFNQSDAPAFRRYTLADHAAAVQRSVDVLTCACPQTARPLERVMHALRTRLDDVEARPTHRDMKPEHVLLGSSAPALIDLDSCALADPVMDPALLLARFTALIDGGGSRQRLSRARSIFADEYVARVPRDWRARLAPHYAAALVDVAAGIFHRQEDGWRRRVALLIDAAAAAASERELHTQLQDSRRDDFLHAPEV